MPKRSDTKETVLLALEKLAGQPSLDCVCPSVFDALALAKQKHPKQKNNLDVLCERYKIDNAHRNLHGAMLDADLLAEVFLRMTRD